MKNLFKKPNVSQAALISKTAIVTAYRENRTLFYAFSALSFVALSFFAMPPIESLSQDLRKAMFETNTSGIMKPQFVPEVLASGAPIVLKKSNDLSFSVLFWNGKSTLGPQARKDAQKIASMVSPGDEVNLYGYAGKNVQSDVQMQEKIAFTRAFNVKTKLVDVGIEPSQVNIVNPKTYLFDAPLPKDPKQVDIKIKQYIK